MFILAFRIELFKDVLRIYQYFVHTVFEYEYKLRRGVEYKDDDFRFYKELFIAMSMINEYDMIF